MRARAPRLVEHGPARAVMPRLAVTMGDLLLFVMTLVLKINLTAKAGASALISIVTGVSILVLDQLLAPKA